MKPNKVFVGVFLTLAALSLTTAFQNCSGKKFNTEEEERLQTLVSNMKAVHFTDRSGTVGDDYRYNIEYDIDIAASKLIILATKGALVTGQPNSATRTLSSEKLDQLIDLLAELEVRACPAGSSAIGGNVSYFELFASSATSPDMKVHGGPDCGFGAGSKDKLGGNGYDDIVNFVKSL